MSYHLNGEIQPFPFCGGINMECFCCGKRLYKKDKEPPTIETPMGFYSGGVALCFVCVRNYAAVGLGYLIGDALLSGEFSFPRFRNERLMDELNKILEQIKLNALHAIATGLESKIKDTCPQCKIKPAKRGTLCESCQALSDAELEKRQDLVKFVVDDLREGK
jgi:hypothetical protein